MKQKPLLIPNKKVNYSKQYRNLQPGTGIGFEHVDDRVDEINSDIAEALKVKTPVVVQEGDTVTAACTTPGAVIFYTTDGSMPNESSTQYTGEITVSHYTVFRFVAVKNGMLNSDELYMKVMEDIIAPPVISLDYRNGEITMTNPNVDGDIYYTDNPLVDPSEDTKYRTKYTGSFIINDAAYFKMCVVIGSLKSVNVEQNYLIAPGGVAITDYGPSINGDYYIRIAFSSGYELKYTLDGSTPDYNSTESVSGANIEVPVYGTTVLKWIEFKEGYVPRTGYYNIERGVPGEPVISAENGLCTLGKPSNTPDMYYPYSPFEYGYVMFYTTDGTQPSKDNGKIYNDPWEEGPFPVSPGTIISAITLCYGMYYSDVATYTVPE